MAKKVESNEPKEPLNIGVINPFALTEVVMGRKVNWKRIADPRNLVEEKLETKYEDLLDPATSPVLYMGVDIPSLRGKKVPKDIPEPVAEVAPAAVRADLLYSMDVPTGTPRAEVSVGATGDWSPPGAVWRDPGDFFEDETEVFDPIQGGLGDCYFIAALASVAWARPYVIANRNRVMGAGAGQPPTFLDMIEFYPQPGTTRSRFEMTELLPMTAGGAYFYAHSSDPAEIWPAVYEKAYARWKTSGTDKPDYTCIAGGDPVRAVSELTGENRYYYWTKNLSADAILTKIRENCRRFIGGPLNQTINPMVAWTYCSAKDAPDQIDYGKAGLAACHAYSVLGWHRADNQYYVVLRNPWGQVEATLDTTTGTWIARELPGYTTEINLSLKDGVFALGLDTFKKYFAGLGVAK